MAFGSGFTVVNITRSDENCDYSDTDILRFDDGYPFSVKWKDDKTLFVKCSVTSGLAKRQPVKKEVIEWKEWTIYVEYYSIYSSGTGNEFAFDACALHGKWLTFRSGNDSLKFDRDEVQLSIKDRKVYVDEFKMDSFNNKLGLSFTTSELKAEKDFNLTKLNNLQPFRIYDLQN
jgi:hypothetical protein